MGEECRATEDSKLLGNGEVPAAPMMTSVWPIFLPIAAVRRKRRENHKLGWFKGKELSGMNQNSLLCFARISDSLNNAKSEQSKREVVETAQKLRVPVPEARIPFVGFVKSLTLKQLICGTIAGGASSALTTPFAIIRTRVVAGQGENSAEEVVQNISKSRGLQSLLPTTSSAWMLSIFIASLKRGVQFVTFEAVKRREEERFGEDKKILPLPRGIPIATVAGALSGVASLLVTYPFNTVQDRLVLQAKEYPSTFGAIRKVFHNEGVRGLYNGLGPAMLKIVPSAAAEFYAYETLKNKYMDQASKNVGVMASLVIGAVAGAFSTTLTYPLELARKEISMSAIPISYNYSNTWQALQGITAREGFGGLYRGLKVELLQIVPSTALSFVVYEIMKRALVAVAEERRDEVKDS